MVITRSVERIGYVLCEKYIKRIEQNHVNIIYILEREVSLFILMLTTTGELAKTQMLTLLECLMIIPGVILS